MPVQKEIIYPVFLQCCQFTTDTFWENIFEDLAYGITPYGTFISKGFLCCGYKNKEFSYLIETKKEPILLYNEIYSLLTDKLGILSNNEKLKKKHDFYNIETSIKEERKNWSNIRQKNIKDLLIEQYVIAMKETYNLSIKQAKRLLSIIFTGIVFKSIDVKDIEYRDGKIVHILGIDFKDKKILLKRDIYNMDNNSTTVQKSKKQLLSDTWKKYIDDIKKVKV